MRFQELTDWGVAAVNPPDLMRRLDFVRAAKTPYELECMRAANRLGALGHERRAGLPGRCNRFEIELAFLHACGLRTGTAVQPDHRSERGWRVLHYQVLEKEPPAQRHSMLIDAGADSQATRADITRTTRFAMPTCSAHPQDERDAAVVMRGIRAGVELSRRSPFGAIP